MLLKVSGNKIFFSKESNKFICHLANFAMSKIFDVKPAAAAIPSALKKFTFSLTTSLFKDEYPSAKFFP